MTSRRRKNEEKTKVQVRQHDAERTHISAHILVPDFGTITATSDMRLATGRTSLLHPTATHTSPTANAFK